MGTCKLRIDWPEAPPKTSAHPPAHHAEEIETKLGIFLVAKARTRLQFRSRMAYGIATGDSDMAHWPHFWESSRILRRCSHVWLTLKIPQFNTL